MPVGVNRPHAPTGYEEAVIAVTKNYSSQDYGRLWDNEYNTIYMYLNWEIGEGNQPWLQPNFFIPTNGHAYHFFWLTLEVVAQNPVTHETLRMAAAFQGPYLFNYPTQWTSPTGKRGAQGIMFQEKSNPKRGFVHMTIPCDVAVADLANAGYDISMEAVIWDTYQGVGHRRWILPGTIHGFIRLSTTLGEGQEPEAPGARWYAEVPTSWPMDVADDDDVQPWLRAFWGVDIDKHDLSGPGQVEYTMMPWDALMRNSIDTLTLRVGR